MKHIIKIMALVVALTAIWIGLLKASVLLQRAILATSLLHCITWMLRSLMVGVGLMNFPTCPQEATLLQQDVVEAMEFLKGKGVDVGTD